MRSRDAVTGEEQGTTGNSPRRWIVDPIDEHHKNFVRGVPVWATLIALAVDDEVVLGVVSAPQLQRRWWASSGNGAWTGRSLLKATQCHVSDVRRLEDASLSYSSLRGWEERGPVDDFVALMRRVWRTRAYGDFWSYMLIAEGAVDLAAEPELAVHDMAAVEVIVREAGGMFTSLDGADGPWGGNALASNGHLHDAALSFLGSMADGDDDPDWRPTGPGSVSDSGPVAADPRARDRARGLVFVPCSRPWPHGTDRRSTMSIAEILKAKPDPTVITIGPDAGVRHLLSLLAEHNVGALIVSNDGESLEGIVSERDVVRHLHHDGTVVDDTVRAAIIDRARRDVCALRPARRPHGDHDPAPDPPRSVVKDGKLVGIISIGDVVKHKLSQLEFERDQLDSYVHQT